MTKVGHSVSAAGAATPVLLSNGTELRRAVQRAAAGNQAAFKELYHEYARPVYNLVFRCMRNAQVAEDVCQEVWVKAYRELHRLDEPQAFPAWLYRIAARACVDASRRNARSPVTTELVEATAPASEDDPEQSALQTERVRLTWEALAAIPARQHLALFLREMERRSYKEISQMLETSESAVETLLFRARQGFAKAFERLDAATQDRCAQAHRSMAAIMDGEATPVQQRAVRAHAGSCKSCSGELSRMQRAAAAYAGLVSLPVPALLGERIFSSISAIGASGGGASGMSVGVSKLVALAGVNAKFAALAVVATAALTSAAIASPIGESVRPWEDSRQAPEQTASGGSGPRKHSAPSTQAGVPEAGESGGAAGGQDTPANPAAPVDGLTSTAGDTVNQTLDGVTQTADSVTKTVDGVTQTVDERLRDVQDVANVAVPTAIPVNVDPAVLPTPIVPVTTPASPLPTPALPPLP